MATERIDRCDKPGKALESWDRTKRYNEQDESIPQVFKDAMAVREAVYVDEQGVRLEYEEDDDDPRSYHWVLYASVPHQGQQSHSPLSTTPDKDERHRSEPSATSTPVATIRLIPPPHEGHPSETQHDDSAPYPPADLYHPAEPYIKLGRLATTKAFRGLGYSGKLIDAALKFAAEQQPHEIAPGWQGLAMVHAQVSVEKLWMRYGFSEVLLRADGSVEAPAQARWMEEGIEHMAMWHRIPLTHGVAT